MRLIEIAGLPWKACPAKQAYVYSLDSVFLWLRKQRPKIRPRPVQGYFRMKDVDRRIEAIAQVNVESKEEKVERAEFNVPTCGHIPVCQRCRDKQIQSLFPTSSLFSTLKVRLRFALESLPAKTGICILLRLSVFPSRPVLPFCPFWLHTFICLNSPELHCWLSSHPHCIKMLGLCFRVYVRRSQGAGTDPAKDSMPRACRRGQGLPSDLPKDSLCLHLVVIDCKFVVRKVFGMTLPKTACPGHAIVS